MGWKKALLLAGLTVAAVGAAVYVAYQWAKQKILEWLKINHIPQTNLEKALIYFESTVDGVVSIAFGKVKNVEQFQPVAVKKQHISEIQDKEVLSQLQSGGKAVRDVTAMFT